MDVKRIESVTVPTALAAVAAGTAGYIIPKGISKEGEITFPLLLNTAVDMHKKDEKLMKEADKLDRFIKADETINNAIAEHKYGRTVLENVGRESALPYSFPTKDDIEASRGILEGVDRKALFNKLNKEFAQPTEEETQKFLEKFVKKHAKDFEIEPQKGQTLTDAVKEYLKGKTAADVKEAFLPSSVRKLMLKVDHYDELERLFEESYDKSKKQFKSDEISQAAAKIFKSAERNMKLKIAGAWASAAGAVALASAFIADRISHK